MYEKPLMVRLSWRAFSIDPPQMLSQNYKTTIRFLYAPVVGVVVVVAAAAGGQIDVKGITSLPGTKLALT